MKTAFDILDEVCRDLRRKRNACRFCGGMFRYAKGRPGDRFIPVLCDGCGREPGAHHREEVSDG